MKQTTDRVSRIAARYLATFARLKKANKLGDNSRVLGTDGVRWSDLAALAASCLSQDETKGKRKRRVIERNAEREWIKESTRHLKRAIARADKKARWK
jgi:hypothetical protein